MAGKQRDLIAEICAQIRAATPDVPEATCLKQAHALCQHLAGSRVYFPKDPAEGKARRLGRALAAGVPLAQAFVDVGVSRSRGFALAKRRWPVT